jgi:cytochrome c oxidase cbb3-type subunit 2
MAEHLHRIPVLFLVVAGAVFVLPYLWPILKTHRVETALVLGVGGPAILFSQATAGSSSRAPVDGRQVYLSEGCIHCHSRYVRPDSPDVLKWGPVVSLEEILQEAPVTIGNRRHGPDLLNVGNRRSEAWLRQHFLDPQSLSPGSSMPSYRHLFAENDQRGDRLIAFLVEQGRESFGERYEVIQKWKPVAQTEGNADGASLFERNCATCHGSEGRGDGPLSDLWVRPPANLVEGPFLYSSEDRGPLDQTLARIIKFGLPGTDMPGHESLGDDEVLALAGWVKSLR